MWAKVAQWYKKTDRLLMPKYKVVRGEKKGDRYQAFIKLCQCVRHYSKCFIEINI